MQTFEEFVASHNTVGANIIFEAGMYSLAKDLEIIVTALREAGVHFEVIGGVAVNAYIIPDHGERSFVTRDIDLLLDRPELSKAVQAGETVGYVGKSVMGGWALVRPGQNVAEAIHLSFVGEKFRSAQLFPHPELRPQDRYFYQVSIPVVPVNDLLHMKLSSFRIEDITHLGILDDVRLITPNLEKRLQPVLQERLKETRERLAFEKPDIEC
jgi:hypothetical protein